MISLLLPSRGRPDLLERMACSAIDTADNPYDLEIVVYVDNDDRSYIPTTYPSQVRVYTTERTVLSRYWNMAAERARGEILMHAADDLVFHTDGWDTTVREAFDHYPDRIVLVFGDDGDPTHDQFGTHSFVHRRWVETLGYFVPPYFSADYNDTWLNELADAIDRKHRVPILTEHMHFALQKGTLDLTHAERLVRLWKDGNNDLYEAKAIERKADAEKLRAAMQ